MTIEHLPANAVRHIQMHAFDIQAIVGSGFLPLVHATYHLMRIEEPSLARAWLGGLLDDHLVKSVADLGRGTTSDASARHPEIAMVAVTHAGILALGRAVSDRFPFPTAYRMGMTHPDRSRLLGDRNVGSWTWTDRWPVPAAAGREGPVHLLVAHYRDRREVDADGPFGAARLDRSVSGLVPAGRADSCPSYTEPGAPDGEPRAFEPFGFRDGISQPVIKGLRGFRGSMAPGEPGADDGRDDVIEPGEFVLGHPTQYNEHAYCPDLDGWDPRPTPDGFATSFGLNGSYLAVRQIRQDVENFRNFERETHRAGDPVSTAERMIGRRKDGTAILSCPAAPPSINDFRYRVDDGDGFQCPRGAHIRRANPRDNLGWDSQSGTAASKLHRLLRRGRVYAGTPDCESVATAACGDPMYRESCGKGLFFMALNADLERQFELVQKRWLSSTSFADLCNESDPLGGVKATSAFSIPALPLGSRVRDFAPFTEVIGGGYFFVPGLTALRFLAGNSLQRKK